MTKALITSFALSFGIAPIAQTEVYNEDFQAGIPVDFTIVDNDGLTPDPSVIEYTDAWIHTVDPDDVSTTDSVMSSTSYFSPAGQANRWMITPSITLGSFGNTLFWEGKSHDASFPDDYLVLISTTDTQISSFSDTVSYTLQEWATWTQHEINLSDYGFNGETIYVAFVNRTNDGFKLYIDDIRVEIDDPASINPITSINLNLYPNPSSNSVKISGIDVLSVAIHGLDGKLLKTIENKNTINLQELAEGNYLFSIETPLGVVT
ncbi:MAG: choice-of-anchor J domain-containing protein, partial [Crocinitomicaceae bacterium]|nr:choice-of-anchor J domain-containing protein [Crocinitomicaceae bacterium]